MTELIYSLLLFVMFAMCRFVVLGIIPPEIVRNNQSSIIKLLLVMICMNKTITRLKWPISLLAFKGLLFKSQGVL